MSIPKNECPHCLGDSMFGCTQCQPDDLAEHPRGEPYGCMMFPAGRREEEFFAFGVPDVSKPDGSGEMWEIVRLYTHADSGEVEALRGAYLRAGEREHELRTELATWKRRAIEAESKLRTYGPQVVELGEQAMQALLAEPKPNELVLTKCKLCDQLQADLTARDQRIDQLERQSQIPDGFALVPKSMLLAKEVIGVINFHCGDTDQEEGGQFGQYTDGRLWVGYVLDDDGNKVHGLHIATDEYQEEGSTTLVEFPAPGEQP